MVDAYGYLLEHIQDPVGFWGNPESARLALREALLSHRDAEGIYAVVQYRRLKLAPHVDVGALMRLAAKNLREADQVGSKPPFEIGTDAAWGRFAAAVQQMVETLFHMQDGWKVGAYSIVSRRTGRWARTREGIEFSGEVYTQEEG